LIVLTTWPEIAPNTPFLPDDLRTRNSNRDN
jgi:hypothetical protein